MQILIAEDDINSQQLTSELLEYFAYEVKLAANGKEALQLFQAHAFDAVIIDLSMPEMDGWQLLKSIQAEQASIPCIAVTAFHSASVARRAKDAGFAAYFPKPIDVYTFQKQLAALLNRPLEN